MMNRGLVIVDFQNDFTPGGRLEVPGADEIAPLIQLLAAEVDCVVATRDWHPADHASFCAHGGYWPVHCVQGTSGAELHPVMADIHIDAIVDVGIGRDDEGFSGFEKSPLSHILRAHSVSDVYVCGVATDYCVRATVLGARAEGFSVTVVTDAIRAINISAGDGARALSEMAGAGAQLATAHSLVRHGSLR